MALNGCAPAHPPVGGDLPVTPSRLRGTKLKLVGQSSSLTWEFGETHVVITNGDAALPSDIVNMLLKDDSAEYSRLEADWSLDEKQGILSLSNITADGGDMESTAELRISPAGPVRVNLVDRQYNMFREPPDASQQ